MKDLTLIHDYKDHHKYRHSFNRLTKKIFGFSLEDWFQKGFWNDRYLPYSYIDCNEIIANVSVNIMDLILGGQKRKAIQIGTVMTHPDYQGKGLSGALMNYVLEKYEKDYDFIYLFANRNVLNYYPKFGFEPVPQSQFTWDLNSAPLQISSLKKLDTTDPSVLKLIHKLALERRPISDVFGVENFESLLMFYSLNFLNDCFYYLEEENLVLVLEQEKRLLHLYDLISPQPVDFPRIIPKIINPTVKQIEFHFTPDLLNINAKSSPLEDEDDVLFVKTNILKIPQDFRPPKTAQA
jgi:GNAT superfamily N-acetyltransferase